MEYKNLNILLVDDDQVDVMAIKGALEEHKIANPVCVAQDGVRALEILRGSKVEPAMSPPFIILLDLNMPRMNGIEFLREIRKDKALRSTIVFVLTTSNDDRDKLAAYEFNIAGYLLKSGVGENFMNLVELLEDFKIIVQFPLSVGS